MNSVSTYKQTLAYVIGVAIGDGNLSNPNGRAVRLRISCDTKYPLLYKRIAEAIQLILPNNKVSIVKVTNSNCINVSCYSNKWEELLGWKAKGGSKHIQNVSIPNWIKEDEQYTCNCLKGLFETDGSLYHDRGYLMANFTTIIPSLALEVTELIKKIGLIPRTYKISTTKNPKYVVRVARDIQKFIEKIGLEKN